MDNPILNSLSESQRKALSQCGITTDSALAQMDYDSLCADLEKVREFFPDLKTDFTEEQLRSLCKAEQKEEFWLPTDQRIRRQVTSNPDAALMGVDDNLPERQSAQVNIDVRPRRHVQTFRARRNTAKGKDYNETRFNYTTSPVTNVLGAIFAFVHVFACVALAAVPFLILMGYVPHSMLKPLVAAPVALMILYWFFCSKSLCPVCRIRVFSFREYPRNKFAHKIPLVGYTLTAALSTIFRLQYRCPSCGTTIKLLGKKKHRH